MKARFIIPLILFLGVIFLLWRGLSLHPAVIPSPLIDKAIPEINAPLLQNQTHTLTTQDFKGHVTLFNVWATWCSACAEEHAFLLELAQKEHIIFYGLDYKDDSIAAKNLLAQYGNPYQKVAIDPTGHAAMDWGVYGTPETFVVDKKGIIRYKQTGPITPDVWEKTLKPLVDKLAAES